MNSFLASGDFCHLLIILQTVWTQIRTNRTSCSESEPLDTMIVFLKGVFENVNFEKKSADDNKSMKNYPACIEKIKKVISFLVRIAKITHPIR